MARTRIVVLSGAGVSAESGLGTFRDSGGLWEQYRIQDVATPEAWAADPVKVLRFYDMRREQCLNAVPNAAHHAIAELERVFDVDVITQNIDDLHERAGSSRVLHLHGELLKARSTADPSFVTRINGPSLGLGLRCPLGSQLRPHIVWFGEEVPLIPVAAALIARADLLIVVGTSLQVHPAAGLVHALPHGRPIWVVDPKPVPLSGAHVHTINSKASEGMPLLALELLREGSA
ncbi:MAG: NAD-dependent deacylase [Flavobacteriales bacterium]|nr:NAD-dependent deacylase [Flavobacteriales bacterium]MCB9166800.1 NAD-dependent deacylase [Flavobacteriales bacterium]